VVLPPAEIADVPLAADRCSPRCIAARDCIIQTDWKQNQAFFMVLSLETGFDFLTHPIALDGVLRQDHKQLLVKPNRLIDALAERVANLEIVGCKPAARALVLEVGVKAFGEVLVLGRIADEAGEELDRLSVTSVAI
jgi:hypothetical protein